MRSSASEPGLIKRELTRSFFIISVALLGAQRALTGTTNFRVTGAAKSLQSQVSIIVSGNI